MPDPPAPPPAKVFDPIAEFLKDRGCPSHVVRAGLKGLVMNWEKVVSELVFDGYRYGLRDFVKDLSRRELLGGAEARLGAALPEAMRGRIAGADQRFRGATLAASRSLLGEDEEARLGLSTERSWWFRRLPRGHRAPFARDLSAAGIQALPDEGV